MTTAQLAQQLSALSDTLKATNLLINRLSKLTFQPGSEPLDAENTVRTELAQDIHDSLKQLEENLELLTQEAEDLTAGSTSTTHKRRDSERDRERTRLSAQVARLGEDLRHSRSHFRRAQLTAKRASEAAKQKERELVFASIQSAPDPSNTNGNSTDLFAGRRLLKQQKQLSKDELELAASTDVTSALRRTHNLLSTELSRSRFAQETFDQSTAALAELGEHYTDLSTILENSRNLLSTLLRSQKSDTWYLETAFYLLLATLCWLVFRRILFGPFVKLPLFLYRTAIFLANWIVLKPLWLFLTLTGIITTRPAGSSAGVNSASLYPSSSRAPLIVHRSATSGPPKMSMADGVGRGVPAGAGGAGAKQGPDPALQGKMSEKIAQMHEQSEQQAEQGGEKSGEVKRGDGTVLQERGEVKRNPKKKMFEADVEDRKEEERRKRDEL